MRSCNTAKPSEPTSPYSTIAGAVSFAPTRWSNGYTRGDPGPPSTSSTVQPALAPLLSQLASAHAVGGGVAAMADAYRLAIACAAGLASRAAKLSSIAARSPEPDSRPDERSVPIARSYCRPAVSVRSNASGLASAETASMKAAGRSSATVSLGAVSSAIYKLLARMLRRACLARRRKVGRATHRICTSRCGSPQLALSHACTGGDVADVGRPDEIARSARPARLLRSHPDISRRSLRRPAPSQDRRSARKRVGTAIVGHVDASRSVVGCRL